MGNICWNKNNWEDNTQNHSDIRPIVIETETWRRDSHGLFDYESNDVIRKTLRLAGTAQIYRNSDDLQFLEYSYRKSFKNHLLLEYSKELDGFSNTEKDEIEESKHFPVKMIKMNSGNTLNPLEDLESSVEPIVQILYTEGQYWIYHKAFYSKNDDFTTKPENVIWYSIRDYRNSASSLGYKLK